jgi:Protein of unknown function (DUF3626)
VEDAWERAVRYVAARSSGGPVPGHATVTLNFHPDRAAGEVPILVSLRRTGAYVSQFVTGTGNGGLTAHPGGDRWRWESRMFGAAYDEAPPETRPVYGALATPEHDRGASPRFGSAHLRLHRHVLPRTTFCYPDSCLEPITFGVAGRFGRIATAVDADDRAGRPEDPLDRYVEAHVHGPVRLDRDVAELVLDPSHRDTDVEDDARRLPVPVRWHTGFRLGVEELRRHPDYRGPAYVALGERLAVDGVLTPRLLGDAARTGRYDPQDLKRVWHYLARFGTQAQAA